ncbi:MAG: secondary thiamine-phosphate synthase enzyme YjbQ [Pseudomonadota bacterium]
MRQTTAILTVQTLDPGLYDVTRDAAALVDGTEGLMTLMCRHTSASLTIQENADPDVQVDLQAAMGRLAPHDPSLYVHGMEGPDDMPAHIRTVLSGVMLSIPIIGGRLSLGTWQGIYLWEHRDRPHKREIAAHILFD